LPGGEIAATGDMVQRQNSENGFVRSVGRVVEIEARPLLRGQPAPVPAEALTRITTGAALRVIG